MSNSSLVVHTNLSPNCSKPRNHVIDTITIHCVVGQCTAETIGSIFKPVERQASSNYGVDKDGRIGMYVEECNRSWCTSSSSNDNRAITIEVASDTTHPYAVNDKAFAALLNLVTDICKRNNIKKLVWSTNKNDRMNHLNGCNMTVHRDYANKSCPGDYLYNLHGTIADEVNKRLGAIDTPVAPASPVSTGNFKNGDIVQFAGGTQYSSANASSGSAVKASKAKITFDPYQVGKSKHPYHIRAVNDNGAFISGVYGWVDASAISAIGIATAASTFTSYLVRVTTTDELNIRKGAGTNFAVVGVIKDKGTYTIVDEATGSGATKWGKLKSGAGWISLDFCKKV